jgi:3-oxoacyl-[acyl-carrier protein] reductase
MSTELLDRSIPRTILAMKKLKNQIAIVTGATRGIGRAIAELFAREGAQVIITGRGPVSQVPAEINATLSKDDKQVQYLSCDISDKEAIQQLISTVLEQYGRLDILVNNAGITKDNLYIRMKEEEWNTVIDTNLNSLFYICQPAIKAMSKQKKGSIINMSSVVGLHGNPAQTNYSTSKAGMIGFSKALAKEYGRRGIRVNCIAPGFIISDMTNELPEEIQNKYKENIPLGDFGCTNDVAELALFLASDSSKYITGQVIQIDGGLFM